LASERLWTPGVIGNFIVLVLLSGFSIAWTYYLGYLPLVNGGFDELIHALQEVNLINPLWWKEFLGPAFDILIISLCVFAFIWVWGNFAVF